jgi:hypothetical protein
MTHLFTVKHFGNDKMNSDSEQVAPETTITQNENRTDKAIMSSLPSTNLSDTASQLEASLTTHACCKLAVHTRLDGILENLKEIRISVENRELLLQCAEKDPDYFVVPKHARNWSWKLGAEKDSRIYYALESQIERIGDNATMEKIMEWEEKLSNLLLRTLNPTDLTNAEIIEWRSYIPGAFQEGWNWADTIEKGSSATVQESVSPETKTTSTHEDVGLYSNLNAGNKAGDWR